MEVIVAAGGPGMGKVLRHWVHWTTVQGVDESGESVLCDTVTVAVEKGAG